MEKVFSFPLYKVFHFNICHLEGHLIQDKFLVYQESIYDY